MDPALRPGAVGHEAQGRAKRRHHPFGHHARHAALERLRDQIVPIAMGCQPGHKQVAGATSAGVIVAAMGRDVVADQKSGFGKNLPQPDSASPQAFRFIPAIPPGVIHHWPPASNPPAPPTGVHP